MLHFVYVNGDKENQKNDLKDTNKILLIFIRVALKNQTEMEDIE